MEWSLDHDSLRGRVAVVAGATRGAGRGIAAALGEAGATVYCSGRSSRSGSLRSDYARPETIEETAELVTRLGGTGIAVAVDHLDPTQVGALAERVEREHGQIDILVNDIWGGELLTGGPSGWNTPIWEHDLDKGLRILRLAIETHLVTSHHLLPLLIREPGGLLVEVTDGTTEYNASHYRISVFYDLAKVAVNRLAYSQGHELASHACTAVAITPGFLRSEMMLETSASPRRPGALRSPPALTRQRHPSSRYPSRPATWAARSRRWPQTPAAPAGTSSRSARDSSREYGFSDVDGSRPDFWRFSDEILERGLEADYADYR